MLILGTPSITLRMEAEYWIILIQAVLILLLLYKWSNAKRRIREMEEERMVEDSGSLESDERPQSNNKN